MGAKFMAKMQDGKGVSDPLITLSGNQRKKLEHVFQKKTGRTPTQSDLRDMLRQQGR